MSQPSVQTVVDPAAGQVKEHPILFSGEMVRAIRRRENPKTQTRRVVKPQLEVTEGGCHRWKRGDGKRIANGPKAAFGGRGVSPTDLIGEYCPYGSPGDRLWVRECFYIDDVKWIGRRLPSERPANFDADCLYYRADGECCEQIPECCCCEVGKPKWRPSIFMPRWASRLTLEVTEVRVERVQAISEADAAAEGVQYPVLPNGDVLIDVSSKYAACKYLRPIKVLEGESYTERELLVGHFASLWDSINADRGYPWEQNPWVWVVTFQVLEGN